MGALVSDLLERIAAAQREAGERVVMEDLAARGLLDVANWPRDPKSGRLLCSPAQPMPKGAAGSWAHTSVVSDGGCSDGCCDDYKCTDCGATWRVEAAE